MLIKKIFDYFGKKMPQPLTELEYSNHFELLVAVILSAQATDVSVNKATKSLFQAASTPKQMYFLGVEGIEKFIRSINLYRNKARYVFKTSKILFEQYDSELPSEREDLQALPGVGRKTANVVLSVAFKKAVIAVDTHVFRVSNRLGIVDAKDVLETEKKLMDVIPKNYLINAHHWLVLHGRYVCLARKPKCDQCGLDAYCAFYQKTNGNKNDSQQI